MSRSPQKLTDDRDHEHVAKGLPVGPVAIAENGDDYALVRQGVEACGRLENNAMQKRVDALCDRLRNQRGIRWSLPWPSSMDPRSTY